MLTIRKSQTSNNALEANVLPCKIQHNGPVNANKRLWTVESENGSHVAHFRGRKLRGRHVTLSDGYTGLVISNLPGRHMCPESQTPEGVQGLDDTDGQDEEDEGGDEDDVDEKQVQIMDQIGSFDRVTIWGHEALPSDDSPLVKGVNEWIKMAAAVCWSCCELKKKSDKHRYTVREHEDWRLRHMSYVAFAKLTLRGSFLESIPP